VAIFFFLLQSGNEVRLSNFFFFLKQDIS